MSRKKPSTNSHRKQCRYYKLRVKELEGYYEGARKLIKTLEDQLRLKRENDDRGSQALTARTELVKALSSAMKTCSSIAWSDRKNLWFDDRR